MEVILIIFGTSPARERFGSKLSQDEPAIVASGGFSCPCPAGGLEVKDQQGELR
jgi:hypothetical protein